MTVMPKPSVNDPQGQAVLLGLRELQFDGVGQVRVGKHIEVSLDAASQQEAERQLRDMCEQLLANTLIESYTYSLGPEGER